jgi:hypothetical protein
MYTVTDICRAPFQTAYRADAVSGPPATCRALKEVAVDRSAVKSGNFGWA